MGRNPSGTCENGVLYVSRGDRAYFMKMLNKHLRKKPERRNAWRTVVLLRLLGLNVEHIRQHITKREYETIKSLGGFNGGYP